MSTGNMLKFGLYAVIALYFVYSLIGGGCSSSGGGEGEEVILPTMGLITELQEVEKDEFKISNETTIPEDELSLVVVNYLDEPQDTFTLDEIKLMESSGSEGSGRGIARAASYGLMGYWMGRSMTSRPAASAYVDQNTYNRVSNNAGNRMQQTARRVTRPSSGRSYGGKSTRSMGG